MNNLIDDAVSFVTNRFKFFAGGLGDRRFLDEELPKLLEAPGAPADIEVRWEKERDYLLYTVREGSFLSPAHARLPRESKRAYIQLALPKNAGPKTPVCVHFAATGDAGYWYRFTAFVAPLLAKGVGAVVLENPYYGLRRPPGQVYCLLHEFSDFFKMTSATVEEGRAIAAWLRRQGHERIGLAGVSMGGSMAALSAATTDFPTAVAPCAAPYSPAPAYCDAVLRDSVNWYALQQDLGADRDPRDYVRKMMNQLDARRYPPPAAAKAAVLTGCRGDRYVPVGTVDLLHKHWPGAELRWVDGGHIEGFLLHRDDFRRAMLDSLERLKEFYPKAKSDSGAKPA